MKNVKMTNIFISETDGDISTAVFEIFSEIEDSSGPILKDSNEVYLKPNGIDFKKHCFTSPVVLKAVIKYFKEKEADVYVMENSTQGNFTRLVFAVNGYKEVCLSLLGIP